MTFNLHYALLHGDLHCVRVEGYEWFMIKGDFRVGFELEKFQREIKALII
jgi:UDP-2,3-diacylglucosamine pyrophosphatase LpxH